MPKVSKEEAEKNRELIEKTSAKLFREQGFNAVSVAQLMANAGLTHGGFYGHFSSKDELIAVACSRAFDESAQRWRQRVSGAEDKAQARKSLIEGYLTTQARNAPGAGCPMPSLAADVAREPENEALRESYVNGVNTLLKILEGTQSGESADENHMLAMSQLSLMVGAMMMSRATQGSKLSAEFLDAARKEMLKQ